MRVSKDGREVEIKDFLTALYLRNGYVPVEDGVKETKSAVDEPKEVKQPRKRAKK